MTLLEKPLLFVTWLDAATSDGWEDGKDEKPPNHVVVSVGWEISRDRKYLTIAADSGIEFGHNRRIDIPRGMIQTIREDALDGPVLYQRKAKPSAKAAAKRKRS